VNFDAVTLDICMDWTDLHQIFSIGRYMRGGKINIRFVLTQGTLLW